MVKKGNYGHSKRYAGKNDVIIRKDRFDHLCKINQEMSIKNHDNESLIASYEERIKDLLRENAQLRRDIDETIDRYKDEIQQLSQFPVDRIVSCYNGVISKLYYNIFGSDDIEELKQLIVPLMKSNLAKLNNYGITTQIFIPGNVWKDSDYSEEPIFVQTNNPDLDNTICNCSLFGLSFKDDFIPTILAKIEVYSYFDKNNDENN